MALDRVYGPDTLLGLQQGVKKNTSMVHVVLKL